MADAESDAQKKQEADAKQADDEREAKLEAELENYMWGVGGYNSFETYNSSRCSAWCHIFTGMVVCVWQSGHVENKYQTQVRYVGVTSSTSTLGGT